MARDFDAEIKKAEEDLIELRAQAAALPAQFNEKAAEFIAEFFNKTIREALKYQPEKFTALSEQGRLPEMKAEVQTLAGKAKELVDEQFDARFWQAPPAVEQTYGEKYFSRYGSSTSDPYDIKLRVIAGKLLTILTKYEIHSAPTVVREGSKWKVDSNQTPIYIDYWEWPPGLSKVRDKLKKVPRGIKDTDGRLSNLRKAKAASEAEDLWDKA